MSKHSPAPWRYDPDVDYECIRDKNDDAIIRGGRSGELVASEADARLIAAAPDLLQALSELLAMCQRQEDFNDDGDGGMYERAQAAIDKATTW